jgi:DNA-binding transcriptional LysR family regulator
VGFIPEPVFEITTMQSLINMVIDRIGVTILPRPYLEYLNHPRIRIIPILNVNLARYIGIIYRKDKYLSAATRIFINTLKETSLHLTQNFMKGTD